MYENVNFQFKHKTNILLVIIRSFMHSLIVKGQRERLFAAETNGGPEKDRFWVMLHGDQLFNLTDDWCISLYQFGQVLVSEER